jgi:hypothetical protein
MLAIPGLSGWLTFTVSAGGNATVQAGKEGAVAEETVKVVVLARLNVLVWPSLLMVMVCELVP